MADMSVADFMAIADRNDDREFGGGIGWLILILLFFFIFAGNGFGGFGGNAQGLTLTNLERDTLNGQKDIEQSVLNTSCATQKGILENGYQTLLGFKDMQQQMSNCCCDIKNTIITENQTTRDLINQHYIDNLSDKLTVARAEINNYQQSNFILGQLGKFYTNPPYNSCGCGCGCNNLM